MRFEAKRCGKCMLKRIVTSRSWSCLRRSPCGLVRRRSGAPAPLRRVLTNPHGGDFFSGMTMSGEGRMLETTSVVLLTDGTACCTILYYVTLHLFHSTRRYASTSVQFHCIDRVALPKKPYCKFDSNALTQPN